MVELYGTCRELGYCDCGGFLGCVDPRSPEERKLLVECQVCDKSHLPDHPHITNIEGDEPIDDEPETVPTEAVSPDPLPPRELPDWLKDKPGSQVIRPSMGPAPEITDICQLCGRPWAPKHECVDRPAGATFSDGVRSKRAYVIKQPGQKCEVCGVTKRSNHNCKGAATDPKPCRYCERAGEPCVRHGGERSGVRTVRRHLERRDDERIATELPEPVAILQAPEPTSESLSVEHEAADEVPVLPAPVPPDPLDQELAAMGTILTALDGLNDSEIERMLRYVADRKGITFRAQP